MKWLHAAARGRRAGELGAWLGAQDSYTLHRPVRRTIPLNPYDENNIMHVWECDLFDVKGLSKYNERMKYLLLLWMVF